MKSIDPFCRLHYQFSVELCKIHFTLSNPFMNINDSHSINLFRIPENIQLEMKVTLKVLNASKLPFKVSLKTPKKQENPLLPPLVLYRAILRSHRKLPFEQRSLGDMYVKAEFRAHKNIDNPLQIIGFISSWQKYLEMVLQNTDQDWKKYHIPDDMLEKLSDDQIIQLHELMKGTRSIYDDDVESGA